MLKVLQVSAVVNRLKNRMDLILCLHLWGSWTRIDWNEFNSLSELERSLNLEHKAEGERFSLVVDDDGNEMNVKQKWDRKWGICRNHRPISVLFRIYLDCLHKHLCTHMTCDDVCVWLHMSTHAPVGLRACVCISVYVCAMFVIVSVFSPAAEAARGQCLSWCNRQLILSLCKRLTAIQMTCRWDRELRFWQHSVITRSVCGDNVPSAFGWLMLHFVFWKKKSLWGLRRD